jgi:elongator complex protein 1
VAFYSGDPSGTAEGDIPDDVSIAPTDASTSGGTFLTRYTGRSNGTLNTQTSRRTSKHKRREERKRARGKKGTVYEEEYLVNSIGRLIERINSVNDDVTRLVEGLIKRRMREQARVAEEAMLEVTQMCKSILDEVFGTIESKTADTAVPEIERPTGGDGVLHDAMQAVQAPKVIPVVKKFERLTL